MRLLMIPCLALGGQALAYAYDGYANNPNQPRFIGVEMSPTSMPVQERNGLTPQQGVQVQGVFGGTAADRAGMVTGDVILAINGAPLSSMSDLRNEVSMSNIGDRVDLIVSRNGQQIPMTTEIQAWPKSIPYEPIDAASEQRFREWQENRLAQAQTEARQIDKDLQDTRKQLNDRNQAKPALSPEEAATERLARDTQLLEGVPGADPKNGWRLNYRAARDGSKISPTPALTQQATSSLLPPHHMTLVIASPDAEKETL